VPGFFFYIRTSLNAGGLQQPANINSLDYSRRAFMQKRIWIMGLALALASSVFEPAWAQPEGRAGIDGAALSQTQRYSHRVIVELDQPALGPWSRSTGFARTDEGRLDVAHREAQAHGVRLRSDQEIFFGRMQQRLPGARIAAYRTEQGRLAPLRYSIVFNGMVIDPGTKSAAEARRIIGSLPGVKRVYPDRAHAPTLYASLPLINADEAWQEKRIGGKENAGRGIKIASMDGGIHKDAPMFSGDGFSYPRSFPSGGLGLTENNNGKIIASRAYFRDWDPPKEGDATAWPGQWGTSHGVHTSGIMAGNIVDAAYLGTQASLSGVAPAAWLMSYRVFYQSVTEDGSFYDAEGIAALEDIVRDGADVVNNSWGGGPSSAGGEFDALDTALRNAWDAGIVVVMSSGNAGPGAGTADHPSSSYLNVAATTSGGTYAAGRISISAPEPVAATLQDISYGTALFGESLEQGKVFTYPLIAADNVNAANITGCSAWAGTPFTGAAALIYRGTCSFAAKVYNAQMAGAELVIIYNNSGDTTMTMSCSDSFCDNITIPSIFIGKTPGQAMEDWCDNHTAEAAVQVSTEAYQIGNTPDQVADFSSRGPGVGLTLKPDIAAPGVNILSQGYTDGAEGEGRHLGFGQASGTSMAAPHVAGAAALLLQRHPFWPPAWIKSALMTTAQYEDIYTESGLPAQPLDIGAGRLDLARAFDPGVIIDPPSLSYGMVEQGGQAIKKLTIRNITLRRETYDIAALSTAGGFDNTTTAAGIIVSPASITLAPFQAKIVEVSLSAQAGTGVGDSQGYVVLTGSRGHEAHVPFWARVKPADANKVLLIDNDFSPLLALPDYLSFYTEALDALSVGYDVLDADSLYGDNTTLPPAAELAAYDAVIYFSGNNYFADGSFTVSTPLTGLDMDCLTEYANNGGLAIVSGQDFAYVAGGHFFYEYVLAGSWLADSVSGGALPDQHIVAPDTASFGFQDITLNVGAGGDGAANQLYIDELAADPFGYPEMPPYVNSCTPLFVYPDNGTDRVVAMLHREQPSLERPGISYLGKTAYLAFGLEGVNDNTGTTTRKELLEKLLDWGRDEPSVTFAAERAAAGAYVFTAALSAPVAGVAGAVYRWDFGDDTGFAGPSASPTAEHQYSRSGRYTVRVEATDAFGNRAVSSQTVRVIAPWRPSLLRP
jgi:subtilisin family serine protease